MLVSTLTPPTAGPILSDMQITATATQFSISDGSHAAVSLNTTQAFAFRVWLSAHPEAHTFTFGALIASVRAAGIMPYVLS